MGVGVGGGRAGRWGEGKVGMEEVGGEVGGSGGNGAKTELRSERTTRGDHGRRPWPEPAPWHFRPERLRLPVMRCRGACFRCPGEVNA